MKSASVATILSVAALAGFGLMYMKLDRLEDRINRTRSAERRTAPEVESPIDRNEPARAYIQDDDPSEPAAAKGESKEKPLWRVELDERLKNLEALVAKGKGKGKKRAHIRSAPQLARQLKLTTSQQDRVQLALENGRQRVEEIMKILDSSGTSPFERRETLRAQLSEAMRTGKWSDAKRAIAQAMRAPRIGTLTIPGRTTTYGEEVERLAGETRTEIAAALSNEQRRGFESTEIGPLLTGGGYEPKDIVGQAKREVAAEAKRREPRGIGKVVVAQGGKHR